MMHLPGKRPMLASVDTDAAGLAWTIAAMLHATIVVIALIVIPRGRKPTAAMAWLLLIVVLPGLGIALYRLIEETENYQN